MSIRSHEQGVKRLNEPVSVSARLSYTPFSPQGQVRYVPMRKFFPMKAKRLKSTSPARSPEHKRRSAVASESRQAQLFVSSVCVPAVSAAVCCVQPQAFCGGHAPHAPVCSSCWQAHACVPVVV